MYILTGRLRHRLGFAQKLVLQVEYNREDGPDDQYGLPEYLRENGLWRDAMVTDLNQLGSIIAQAPNDNT